jgi:excisionase family DNA binding protein
VSEHRDVLTVKEAAALARVSPATIRRWCRLGHLHAFQVGRGSAIRIPADALRELLARAGP